MEISQQDRLDEATQSASLVEAVMAPIPLVMKEEATKEEDTCLDTNVVGDAQEVG
jgi:hypothetical protein